MSSDRGKATIDLLNATRAIVERDLELGLVAPERLRFTIEARKEEVKKLADQGLSQRQIAKAVGTSKTQVTRDLEVVQKGPESGPKGTITRAPLAEKVEEKIEPLDHRRNISLDNWKRLSKTEQTALLKIVPTNDITIPNFNAQKSDDIEWAQWSWNPVTGCLHDCPYCYARDIANQAKMRDAYPHGFAPAFRPAALLTPRRAKVPTEAETDTRFKNVFTCSMADLFGRWVPSEWIEAVLGEIRNAPQWNFLCLTKFPKRMAEFDIPSNAWMGTTVDLQARVAAAEAGFEKVKAGVRWLSVEPMLEPLKFKHLDRFDWLVLGGASSSTKTPEWRPPAEWIADLEAQARAAGIPIYEKTNLRGRRIIELPFDAPIPTDKVPSPAIFHYLGKTADATIGAMAGDEDGAA